MSTALARRPPISSSIQFRPWLASTCCCSLSSTPPLFAEPHRAGNTPTCDCCRYKIRSCFNSIRHDPALHHAVAQRQQSQWLMFLALHPGAQRIQKIGEVDDFRLAGCIEEAGRTGSQGCRHQILVPPTVTTSMWISQPTNLPLVLAHTYPSVTAMSAPMASNPLRCWSTGREPMAAPSSETSASPARKQRPQHQERCAHRLHQLIGHDTLPARSNSTAINSFRVTSTPRQARSSIIVVTSCR